MNLFDIRRDFSLKILDEQDSLSDPIEMLRLWLNNAIEAEALEPTAMTISTVSADGRPSSRIVLLKEIKANGLTFFTNYDSRKGVQIANNQYIAANFMWHELERQVRVEGKVKKLADDESDKYYAMRPRDSQIGAWVSPQSQVIPNRLYLDERVSQYRRAFDGKDIHRPSNWGGYVIEPEMFEFWQGRKNRLHDRIEYLKQESGGWITRRLAP